MNLRAKLNLTTFITTYNTTKLQLKLQNLYLQVLGNSLTKVSERSWKNPAGLV